MCTSNNDVRVTSARMATTESVSEDKSTEENDDSSKKKFSGLRNMCRVNGIHNVSYYRSQSCKLKDSQTPNIAAVFKRLNGLAHNKIAADSLADRSKTNARTCSKRSSSALRSKSIVNTFKLEHEYEGQTRRVSPRRLVPKRVNNR